MSEASDYQKRAVARRRLLKQVRKDIPTQWIVVVWQPWKGKGRSPVAFSSHGPFVSDWEAQKFALNLREKFPVVYAGLLQLREPLLRDFALASLQNQGTFEESLSRVKGGVWSQEDWTYTPSRLVTEEGPEI